MYRNAVWNIIFILGTVVATGIIITGTMVVGKKNAVVEMALNLRW